MFQKVHKDYRVGLQHGRDQLSVIPCLRFVSSDTLYSRSGRSVFDVLDRLIGLRSYTPVIIKWPMYLDNIYQPGFGTYSRNLRRCLIVFAIYVQLSISLIESIHSTTMYMWYLASESFDFG